MSSAPWLATPVRLLRRLPRGAVVAGCLAVGLTAALWLARPRPRPATGAPVEDPRLSYPTPFLNVRPEVAYVGSTRCGECHPEAASYAGHPMSRSFAPAAAVADHEHDRAAHNPFTSSGFLYRAERRRGEVVHTAMRSTGDGKELYHVAAPVAFAIGSGTHGRSFLVERDGYLFQSPITWFPQAGRWDLSPGYRATTLFDRPIKSECLFCHCNEAREEPHAVNRYQALPTGGIGCERCHGPAELHLRARAAGQLAALPDETIVNPARLSPVLRDAVCEQCHLQGEARILRRGRETFDYRPGLPLHLFWSVFVRPPELSAGLKFVGHSEQMRASVCAQKSAGKLGCISCHDPHRLPAEKERVGYYRARCARCHEDKPCRRQPPPGERHRQDHREDNCVGCHMPRRDNADIIHTTVVDHRILRRDEPSGAVPAVAPRPGQMPLVPFHQDLIDPESVEAARDKGLAILSTAKQQQLPPWAREAVGQLAQPLLDKAVRHDPDDIAALEGRALALALQGRPREALAGCEQVLHRAPRREATLALAADMAATMNQLDSAQGYWERALDVNPWLAHYHARFAEVLGRRGRWSEALERCRAALRLNPAKDVRKLLVNCLLRRGDREGAEGEFRILLEESPGEQQRLHDWWAKQAR
jgi:Tfp pilus assembly protein PilF